MKANCKALKLSIAISLISFIIIFVLAIITLDSNCKILEIILNIFIGVFGSGCVALLLSIPSYNVSKRQLLEKFWQEAKELIRKISDIQFLFNEYTDDTVVSYLNELKNKKWKEEFNKISKEKVDLDDEKYKELLIDEFINNRPNLKDEVSMAGIHEYANECVNRDIEKLRKKAKKIYTQYIEISNESTIGLSFKLGDMEFLCGKKPYNKVYSNLYKPLFDILDKIQQESYHFQLFLDGEGNEAVALEKLLEIQNEIFGVEIKETDEFKSYIINNKIFDSMLINLEIFRADMYGIKPEKQELHPIECRRYSKKR